MTFILLEVRDSFQYQRASAKYTLVTVTAETLAELGILCTRHRVPLTSSKLLVSKTMIVFYGKPSLAVEPAS